MRKIRDPREGWTSSLAGNGESSLEYQRRHKSQVDLEHSLELIMINLYSFYWLVDRPLYIKSVCVCPQSADNIILK